MRYGVEQSTVLILPKWEPDDASTLLAGLSGIAESDYVGKKVAEALDHQPLALASAATYVKQLRQSKNLTFWLKRIPGESRKGPAFNH